MDPWHFLGLSSATEDEYRQTAGLCLAGDPGVVAGASRSLQIQTRLSF